MTPISGRVWPIGRSALLAPAAYASLVLDGHHVAPPAYFVRAARQLDRVRPLVSDAMPPAASRQGTFELQGRIARRRRPLRGRGRHAWPARPSRAVDAVRIAVDRYAFTIGGRWASATRVPAEAVSGWTTVAAAAFAPAAPPTWWWDAATPTAVIAVRPLDRRRGGAGMSHRAAQGLIGTQLRRGTTARSAQTPPNIPQHVKRGG